MGLLAAEAVDGTEMEIIGDGNIVAGVNRIWVHPSQRRKGIASKLLDQMRGGFVFGCCLAKSQIAFSQPTDAGKILACKYLSTPHPPIYHRRRE
jgi:N-acetyltransferase